MAMVVALALALGPIAMPAMAEAATAAPAAHHGGQAGADHCDEQGQADRQDRQDKAAKDCCVAMCVAVVVPAGAAELPDYHPARERPVSDLYRLGYLGEIATPPPRAA